MRLFRLPASVVASCQATMLVSPAITGEEVPIGRPGEEEGPRHIDQAGLGERGPSGRRLRPEAPRDRPEAPRPDRVELRGLPRPSGGLGRAPHRRARRRPWRVGPARPLGRGAADLRGGEGALPRPQPRNPALAGGVAARTGREPLLELGAPPARAVGARGRHLTRLLRLHDGLRAIDGGRPDLLSHAPHPRGGTLSRRSPRSSTRSSRCPRRSSCASPGRRGPAITPRPRDEHSTTSACSTGSTRC
jgi:hypothetical protein